MKTVTAWQEARLGRKVEEQLQLDKEIKLEVRRDKREFCKKLTMEGWKWSLKIRSWFHTKPAGFECASEKNAEAHAAPLVSKASAKSRKHLIPAKWSLASVICLHKKGPTTRWATTHQLHTRCMPQSAVKTCQWSRGNAMECSMRLP